MPEIKWFKRAGRLALAVLGVAALVDAYPYFREGVNVWIGLEEVATGLFWIAFGVGLKSWSSGAWAARGTLLVLAYCVYAGHSVWRPVDWAAWAFLVVAALAGQHIAHRHALGWIIDAQGERQKVDHWSRGNAVYKPTSYSERIALEATLKVKRRWAIALYGLPGAGLELCAWWLHQTGHAGSALIVAILGAAPLLPAAWALLVEIAFQMGMQDMPGAKVLDPPPVRPGLRDIAEQKAHGDASFAGEDEALQLLQSEV